MKTYFKETPSNSEYVVGESYMHPVFGKGKLTSVEGRAGDEKLTLYFPKAGEKKILAKFVKLTKA